MDNKDELARILLLLISKDKVNISLNGKSKYLFEMCAGEYIIVIDEINMVKLVNLSVDIVEQLLLLPNAGLDANIFHKVWKEAIHIACASGGFDLYKMSDALDKCLNDDLKKLVDCVPLIMKKSKVLYLFFDKPLIVLAIFKAYSGIVTKSDEHENLMAADLILRIILMIKAKKIEKNLDCVCQNEWSVRLYEHTFSGVVACLIDDARNFSIEGFEEDYSAQEIELLVKIKDKLLQLEA